MSCKPGPRRPPSRWRRVPQAVLMLCLAQGVAAASTTAQAESAAAPGPEAQAAAPASATPLAGAPDAAAVPSAAPATAAAPVSAPGAVTGKIAWYGRQFAGRKTASGERFDPALLTMAHRHWPLGTQVRVTNLRNQRSVVVTVNDRGPYTPGRIADLSEGAARLIGLLHIGVTEARLERLERLERPRPDTADRRASPAAEPS